LFPRHTTRVGTLAWNDHCIYSGSRDRFILNNDTRSSKQERKLAGHRQEVFGLKWSPDRQLLASGGNDNRLLVWN
jgi:cell division cycle 20-like protein 1 (cofactor of APC complex)